MVNARRNSLIALLVFSSIVVQAGCGGGDHSKRQHVDRLLGKDGKPSGAETPKKDEPKTESPGGETKKNEATQANDLVNLIATEMADAKSKVEPNKLVGAGTYTLSAVTASYRFQENDSDSVFAGVFHANVGVSGDVAALSDADLKKHSGTQGSNIDAGKAFELAVHFELSADGKLDKVASKDLNTLFTEAKLSVTFGDGSPIYKIEEILNGTAKKIEGDTVIISKVDDSTARIQIEAHDGSTTRTVVAEYKKTAPADPGPTNINAKVEDRR